MIALLLWTLSQLVDAYILVIVVWCITSWFPNVRSSRLGGIINWLIGPYMYWFDFTLPTGGISFAPMTAILALYLIQAGLVQTAVII